MRSMNILGCLLFSYTVGNLGYGSGFILSEEIYFKDSVKLKELYCGHFDGKKMLCVGREADADPREPKILRVFLSGGPGSRVSFGAAVLEQRQYNILGQFGGVLYPENPVAEDGTQKKGNPFGLNLKIVDGELRAEFEFEGAGNDEHRFPLKEILINTYTGKLVRTTRATQIRFELITAGPRFPELPKQVLIFAENVGIQKALDSMVGQTITVFGDSHLPRLQHHSQGGITFLEFGLIVNRLETN